MEFHREKLHEPVTDSMQETLASTLDSPEYHLYAEGVGPLGLDEMPEWVRTSDTLMTVRDHFGWPSQRDASIRPVTQFEHNQPFLKAVAARGRHLTHLNNFIAWISQQPTYDPIDFQAPMEHIYGRAPALHRLHAVAPDLAGPVQALVAEIRSQTGTHTAAMEQTLRLPQNDDLLTGLRLSYHIAGRLFTVHDKRLQAKVLLPNQTPLGVQDVVSAMEELTA